MPWSGFAAWNDAAQDSFGRGVAYALAAVLVAGLISWTVTRIASVWRSGSLYSDAEGGDSDV